MTVDASLTTELFVHPLDRGDQPTTRDVVAVTTAFEEFRLMEMRTEGSWNQRTESLKNPAVCICQCLGGPHFGIFLTIQHESRVDLANINFRFDKRQHVLPSCLISQAKFQGFLKRYFAARVFIYHHSSKNEVRVVTEKHTIFKTKRRTVLRCVALPFLPWPAPRPCVPSGRSRDS